MSMCSCRAVRLTGPFVTMIYSMITGDMLTFGLIYSIVLFGFSQSFYFLYKGYPGVNSTLYHSYPSTWMALFQITLGNYDYQELGATTYPAVAKSVFAIFMVFVPILLLNMLIAMMGNTYAHVIEQSEKEWMKQWAKIVITLERAVPQADAHHYLQEYSISLGPSEDPSTEQRGVMVIKSKNKTRAKQRKGAVANWKRVGKVTIKALKKKGMTGEEMRCMMWGRESINTPIKIKGPKKDPLMNPQGPDLTGGFGDALTVALDVMAFTHELDINGAAQGLNLAQNVKPASKDTKQKDTPPINQINFETGISSEAITGSAMLGALSQLTESQGLMQPSQTTSIPQDIFTISSTVTPIKIDDPLKELVLCSSDETADPEKLKFLAQSAANLAKLEEAEKSQGQVTKSVKVLAGIFTGTETFVKKVEGNLRKKYSALDPSDSEGFGEQPLLGKISRSRRAKSAHIRNSSARSKMSDKRKLFLESDSSLTDVNGAGIDNENFQSAVDVIGVQEEDSSITISETITIKGFGNGEDTQEPNSKPETKSVKQKRKKRPRTARCNNRVAPITDGRQCWSAKDQLDSEGSESPDPLEPWSTKNIVNMNKILAWDNNSQDSF